jgi:hypothetical protein
VELEPAIDFACSRASTSNISGGSLHSSSLPAKQMRKTPSCKSKGPGRKRRVSTETDITSVFLAAREESRATCAAMLELTAMMRVASASASRSLAVWTNQ